MVSDKRSPSDQDPPHADEVGQDSANFPSAPSLPEHTDWLGTEILNQISLLVSDRAIEFPFEFGKYSLIEKIGSGGAGVVFRARPINGDGVEEIAIKILRPEFFSRPQAVRRFEKEARLHAEIESPYVNRLLDFGCVNGSHYIASAFIDGVTLSDLINEVEQPSPHDSLRVIRDVLRALNTMHSQRLIHRDVKPGNILVSFTQPNDTPRKSLKDFTKATLLDFGLAKEIDQNMSLDMTQQYAALGTPQYMAPEQHLSAKSVDERADTYSLGVTLYELLAGTLPFDATESLELAEQHRSQRPRPLSTLRKGISEAISNVVAKALEKDPGLRYQKAGEMLADIERILDGKPIHLRSYPATPDIDDQAVRKFDFEFEVNVPHRRLWTLIADTDRFNRGMGLPAPIYTHNHTSGGRVTWGTVQFMGMKMRWREHPFQWIQMRELSVLRELEKGPFQWITSTVELFPQTEEVTLVRHCFRVKPRGLLGQIATPLQFNFAIGGKLKKVYRQIESVSKSCPDGDCFLPFSQSSSGLSKKGAQQLKQRLAELAQHKALSKFNPIHLANRLGEFLTHSADRFVAAIRPFKLADVLECEQDEALRLCMAGVDTGVLKQSWEVICPICQIASRFENAIERIGQHEHCDVCNLDFEVDFSNQVELVFEVSSEIRTIDRKTYCIGGPFHAPHVIAQNRLLAQQFVDVGATLESGSYRIAGPQLPQEINIRAKYRAPNDRVEIVVGRHETEEERIVQAGRAVVSIENATQHEVLVRLQQAASRETSFSAAMAYSHSATRHLLANANLRLDQLVESEVFCLLGIGLELTEADFSAHGELSIREHWTLILSLIESDGAEDENRWEVVEVNDESIWLAYRRSATALDGLVNLLGSIEHRETLFPAGSHRIAVCRGTVLRSNKVGRPEWFGSAIRSARATLSKVSPGQILVDDLVAEEQRVKLADQFGTRVAKGPAGFQQFRL